MEKIYFVSGSSQKYEEIRDIVRKEGRGWDIEWTKASLMELQEDNSKNLIEKKALEAFKLLKRPVLVEHTALLISAFNELPGLHTSYFYSKLGYQKIVDYCHFSGKFDASVKSIFCLCDGKRFYFGEGEEAGEIVQSTNGIQSTDGFDWDVIFVPYEDNPKKETYACMKDRKNRRSMRKLAWDNLVERNESRFSQMSGTKSEEKLDELAKLIADERVILFVGAGISASVSFPSWKNLIDNLGKELGYEAELFESYGEYMLLAEYAGLGRQDEVYRQLCDTFRITDDIKEKLYSSRIYEILHKLDFKIIYTTNYDSLLETYYTYKNTDFMVVKNIEDMKKIKSKIPRIMKFHGDLDPKYKDSIVLSESGYFKRMDFEYFMDVQLQADMMQYSILFLGYGLSDINVKLLMYLARKRGQKYDQALQEHDQTLQSYIYTATPNYIQEEVFLKNNIITFSGTNADKEQGTLEFLEKLCNKVDEVRNSM